MMPDSPPEGLPKGESSSSGPSSDHAQPSNTGMLSGMVSGNVPPAQGNPSVSSNDRKWQTGNGPVVLILAFVVAVAVVAAWGLQSGFKWASAHAAKAEQLRKVLADSERQISHGRGSVDPETQLRAEQALQRLAQGSTGASDAVLDQAGEWTGKTHRTPATDQALDTALNSNDLHVRAAALEAQLALDGVSRDANGLADLEQAVGSANQRAWALWSLGAMGGRGVDPVHTAKIIDAYLDDPSAEVRTAAVNGLVLVGSDETIPMVLDRFRNDPSPEVQERAACGLAQSGMYSHEQRMNAAGTLIGWLDDPLLTTQQKRWVVQALQDISGQNFGTDSAAWQEWFNHNQ